MYTCIYSYICIYPCSVYYTLIWCKISFKLSYFRLLKYVIHLSLNTIFHPPNLPFTSPRINTGVYFVIRVEYFKVFNDRNASRKNVCTDMTKMFSKIIILIHK